MSGTTGSSGPTSGAIVMDGVRKGYGEDRATAYKIIVPSITWLGSHHSEPPAPSSSCS